MALDDLISPDVGREAANGADYETEEDDAEDLEEEQKPPSCICIRMEVAKADSQNGLWVAHVNRGSRWVQYACLRPTSAITYNISIVECVWICPALKSRKDGRSPCEPEEEHHRL
jgi:hypothetical protein